MARQTGETTRQMQTAPQGAVFVWVNAHLNYPQNIAKKLGREDLEIVSPFWLESEKWRGRMLTGVIVDHACRLTEAQADGLEGAKAYIRY